jgi:transcriptional regulator with XRE-family HTH domain
MRAEKGEKLSHDSPSRRDDSDRQADASIGHRVRLRRTLLGMNQEQLAKSLGISFQQVQKYENGANRIGGSRIWKLSQLLDVPPSFFFDDLTFGGPRASDATIGANRFLLELARAVGSIPDDRVRQRFLELAKALTQPTDDVARQRRTAKTSS